MSYSSYQVITPPAALPVTLEFIKIHLRLDTSDSTQDDYLTILIKSARDTAEKYIKRVLVNTSFRTFRDRFSSILELRRSKLQTIDSFQYKVNGSFVTVSSSIYYNTFENDYSKILLNDGESYPEDIDIMQQSIKIDFTAGFGSDDTSIPSDIKIALANHVALIYEDRGDCNTENIPAETRRIYDLYRIPELVGELDYNVY